MPAASLLRSSRARRPMLQAPRRLGHRKADPCRHQCAQSRACAPPPSCFAAPERQEQQESEMANLTSEHGEDAGRFRKPFTGTLLRITPSEAAPRAQNCSCLAESCVLRAADAAAAAQQRERRPRFQLATAGFEPRSLDSKTSAIPLYYGVAYPIEPAN